jgi:hypothetical protein
VRIIHFCKCLALIVGYGVLSRMLGLDVFSQVRARGWPAVAFAVVRTDVQHVAWVPADLSLLRLHLHFVPRSQPIPSLQGCALFGRGKWFLSSTSFLQLSQSILGSWLSDFARSANTRACHYRGACSLVARACSQAQRVVRRSQGTRRIHCG